jgi:hypothetical protein
VSPSSSMKYSARGIDKVFPWIIEWLGGGLATFGAALVTVTVNVRVTEAGRGSETVNVIV